MASYPIKIKGINIDVIIHKLNVRKKPKVVKQRKKNFTSERQEVIKEEINELLDVKFVHEVIYLD